MELNDFLMHVAMRKPLDTPEIMELLNRMSDEARRITFELNGSYHTMDEIRALMSRLFLLPYKSPHCSQIMLFYHHPFHI